MYRKVKFLFLFVNLMCFKIVHFSHNEDVIYFITGLMNELYLLF